MDGMLNEKMKQLLADPDALSRVMETARSLFSGADEQEAGGDSEPAAQARKEPIRASAAEHTGQGEMTGAMPSEAERMRLLDAICPFLSPQRRQAAESMLRIWRLLSMAERSGILSSFGMPGGREG